MSQLDTETRRKMREMAAGPLLDALLAQDDTMTMGLSFEQRVGLAVDEAHTAFTHAKVQGLIRRAQLRYPNADLRRVDLLEERGLNQNVLNQLATCSSIGDKTWCFKASAVRQILPGLRPGQTGLHHAHRAHYIRMPDLEEAWIQAADKPQGQANLLKKYASFTILVR